MSLPPLIEKILFHVPLGNHCSRDKKYGHQEGVQEEKRCSIIQGVFFFQILKMHVGNNLSKRNRPSTPAPNGRKCFFVFPRRLEIHGSKCWQKFWPPEANAIERRSTMEIPITIM